MINKSLLSNVVALMLVMVGYLMESPYQRYILNTGLFALSGGITNWLAVHMLFERVPVSMVLGSCSCVSKNSNTASAA